MDGVVQPSGPNDPILLKMLDAAGALQRGHYQIDQVHTDVYFDKHKLLLTPRLATRVYRRLAQRVEFLKPDLVLGPLTSGVLIAYDVARYLGCDCIYFALDYSEGGIAEYWGGYDLSGYSRILIVDDIVVTGRTIDALQTSCNDAGLPVVGIANLIQYPSFRRSFDVPHITLAPSLFCEYEAQTCPLCALGQPIEVLR